MLSSLLLALLPATVLAQAYGSNNMPDSSSTASSAMPAMTGMIEVDVGEGGLVFSPNSVTAAVGAMVVFSFYPKNHSVAQSTFDSPCAPSGDSALFSGFIPSAGGEAGMKWTLQINNTDPIWLYCSQKTHCTGGMVMVINPPSDASKNIDAFKANAMNATTEGSPVMAMGGVLSVNTEANSTTASGSASGSASASAASASASGGASALGMPEFGAIVGAAAGVWAWMLV